jgi:hypothetical protein
MRRRSVPLVEGGREDGFSRGVFATHLLTPIL